LGSNLDIIQTPSISELLDEAHLARMATCNSSTQQPHVVPVWYEWDGESIWISSFRSARKVREIVQNPRVSLVIDTPGTEGQVPGVAFERIAKLITDPAQGVERGTRFYRHYIGRRVF
jgi:general stress protein 26